MKTDHQLFDEVVARIRTVMDPDAIVVFGSRGRGQASPESDLDLIVIARSSAPRHCRAIPVRRALRGLAVPQDILVYTPAEVDEWRTAPTSLVATALREGRVIYENRH